MSTASTGAILIVAPPTLQRQGLLAILSECQPDRPLHAITDLRTLPQQLARVDPELIILDATQSSRPLINVIEQFRAQRPQQRVLVVGGRRLPFRICRLIVEMGGGMLLAAHATPADLVGAVERLLGPPPSTDSAEEPHSRYARLMAPLEVMRRFSPREQEVLQLVAEERTSQEIAASLSISIRTVETHRRMLLEKSGYRSMIGLVLAATRQGWLQVV